VRRADGGTAIVGFDGALWLERYVGGEALRWRDAGADCRAVAPLLGADRPRPGPLSCHREAVQ